LFQPGHVIRNGKLLLDHGVGGPKRLTTAVASRYSHGTERTGVTLY
jgi:hypothetical protein